MKRKSKYINAVEVYREYEHEREVRLVMGLPTLVFDCWCKDKDMGGKVKKDFSKVFDGFESVTCYGGSWSDSDTHEPDLIYKGNDVVGVWCKKCGITYLSNPKKFKKVDTPKPSNLSSIGKEGK